MLEPVQVVAVVVSATLLVVVLDLVRRRRLAEEHSFVWIACATAMLVLSLWRDSLHLVARWLGVYYPPAVLLLVLILFVFAASLTVSVVLSRQRAEIERLTEEVALLDAACRDMEKRLKQRETDGQPSAGGCGKPREGA